MKYSPYEFIKCFRSSEGPVVGFLDVMEAWGEPPGLIIFRCTRRCLSEENFVDLSVSKIHEATSAGMDYLNRLEVLSCLTS